MPLRLMFKDQEDFELTVSQLFGDTEMSSLATTVRMRQPLCCFFVITPLHAHFLYNGEPLISLYYVVMEILLGAVRRLTI